jgi:hypothetical protein
VIGQSLDQVVAADHLDSNMVAPVLAPAKAVTLSHGEEQVMQALRDHPYLSARQLKLHLNWPLRTTRHYLQKLKQRGWIQRNNAKQPWLHARALHALAPSAIADLAAHTRMTPEHFAVRAGLDPQRLARLAIMMERVFQVRTFLLWLRRTHPGWEWKTHQWDVELGKIFHARDKAFRLPFHGAAIMSRPDSRWAFVVVEWDLRRVAVEKDRERLIKLVLAQDDARFWGPDKEELFPIWVLIAQDELRLQDYYALMRAVAVSRQLPMPRAYMTTFAEVMTLREYPAYPIWYSTISGRKTPLLHDTPGSTTPMPTKAPWQQLRLERTERKEEINDNDTRPSPSVVADRSASVPISAPRTGDPLAIAQSLGTAEKLILDEIANHPLLSMDEMAVLLHLQPWRAKEAINKLVALDLVEAHSVKAPHLDPPESLAKVNNAEDSNQDTVASRFVLAASSVPYLAMIAGFERAARRFVRARGWLDGFDTLVRFWEHTREENAFFLGLAEIARQRHDELVWISELEGRLFYDDGHEYLARVGPRRPRPNVQTAPETGVRRQFVKPWRRSFLPDGRGRYSSGGLRFEFALEIDRNRQAKTKMRRKLLEYYACLTSNILRGKGIELLRLLIVTTGWKRAESLVTTALELEEEVQVKGLLPIFITTFNELRQHAANEAIWLCVDRFASNETALPERKTYCFDCFVPCPRRPRKNQQAKSVEKKRGSE